MGFRGYGALGVKPKCAILLALTVQTLLYADSILGGFAIVLG
jgi:hypothetical protein